MQKNKALALITCAFSVFVFCYVLNLKLFNFICTKVKNRKGQVGYYVSIVEGKHPDRKCWPTRGQDNDG